MKNKSYCKGYFSHQMWRLKTCTVFSIIFAVLGMPTLTIANSLSGDKELDFISIPLMVISVIALIGTMAVSFATPVIALQHLYKKVDADNILSLPLTAKQRFIGDMGAIFVSLNLPMLFSVLSVLLIDIFNIRMEVYSYDVFFMYAISIFVVQLLLVAFNSAIISCCGRIVEAILYPIAMNIMLPIMTYCGAEMCYRKVLGLGIEGYGLAQSSGFISISPFGALYHLIGSNMLYYSVNYGVIALISTAVFGVLAFFLYKFRHAENIGKPFVYKYAYPFFSTVFAAGIVLFYFSSVGEFDVPLMLPIALILFIIMLVMDIIQKKSFKGMGKLLIRWAVTLGATTGLCMLLVASRGFGESYYVPKAEKVDGLYLSMYSRDGENEYAYHNLVFISDKDIIKLAGAEHEIIIDKLMNKTDTATSNVFEINSSVEHDSKSIETTVSFTYYLNKGKEVYREYNVGSLSDGLWQSIFESEGYRTSEIERVIYGENQTDYGRHYISDVDTLAVTNPHNPIYYYQSEITEDFFDSLKAALTKDLSADSEYGRHDEQAVFILEFGKYYENEEQQFTSYVSSERNYFTLFSIPVYESYTNTISLLSGNMDLPTLEESIADSIKDTEIFTLYRFKPHSINQSFQYCYNSGDVETVFITAEEFKELSKYHVAYNNNTGDDGYVYAVTRGLALMDSSGTSDKRYEAALSEIGIDSDAYAFTTDNCLYNGVINTDYNKIYRAIMESRTILK